MSDHSSEPLREAEAVERYRALGDDYAFYGLTLPADAPDALKEGHHAGVARRARPAASDRFVRKWLQLRYQALARGRAVSDDVTIEFLRFLDVPVCPVTLMTLTHGALKPSDWSIDRLNNNGAYATSNLAVMSTQANRAKGAKSLAEVRELSEGTATVDGLSSREWARMAATMFGPCYFESRADGFPIRQVAPLPEPAIRVQWQLFQDFLVRAAVGLPKKHADFLPRFLENLPNNQLRSMVIGFVRLIRERVNALSSPFDVWFDDDLFDRYGSFYQFLFESTHGEPLRVMGHFYDAIPIGNRIAGELRLSHRGDLN